MRRSPLSRSDGSRLPLASNQALAPDEQQASASARSASGRSCIRGEAAAPPPLSSSTHLSGADDGRSGPEFAIAIACQPHSVAPAPRVLPSMQGESQRPGGSCPHARRRSDCCLSSNSQVRGPSSEEPETAPFGQRGAVSRCASACRPVRARRGPVLGCSHLGGSECARARPAARRFHWMSAWPVPCLWRNGGSWPLQMPVPLWLRRRHLHRASDPAQGSAGACRARAVSAAT
jgi:hypothetical protein